MKKFIKEFDQIASKLENTSINACWRSLSELELDNIPDEYQEEAADGSTYLQFSDGTVIGFYAHTEAFTVQFKILPTKGIPENAIETSRNAYWQKRINTPIVNIKLIYQAIPQPAGLEFFLSNQQTIRLLYVSENEYTFDALVIDLPDDV
jgi:hypothetical protein